MLAIRDILGAARGLRPSTVMRPIPWPCSVMFPLDLAELEPEAADVRDSIELLELEDDLALLGGVILEALGGGFGPTPPKRGEGGEFTTPGGCW